MDVGQVSLPSRDDLQQDQILRRTEPNILTSDLDRSCPCDGLSLEGQEPEDEVDADARSTLERQNTGLSYEGHWVRGEYPEFAFECSDDSERVRCLGGNGDIDVQGGAGLTPDCVGQATDDHVIELMLFEESSQAGQSLFL